MDEMKDGNSMGSSDEAIDAARSNNGAMSNSVNGRGNVDPNIPQVHYTIPGILHFLQHEWSRFEMERSQWEVEKSELQARIAFLQGERKGQENLKNDLVRRIKMLEYALKQERVKYNKLKYGPDSNNALDPSQPPTEEDGELPPPVDGDSFIAVSNVNWRQGRQLLRQYLQEIGYTDTIIDVRSNRVRSLLGLTDVNEVGGSNNISEESNNLSNLNRKGPAVNGDGGGANRTGVTNSNPTSRKQETGKKGVAPTLAEEMLLDTEAAVMANFDFLSTEVEVEDDEDDEGEEGDDGYNAHEMKLKVEKLAQSMRDVDDKDTEEVMNEFNFLSKADTVDSIKSENKDTDIFPDEWGVSSDEAQRLRELYESCAKKRRTGLGVDFLNLSGGSGRQSSTGSTASSNIPSGGKKDPVSDIGTNLELGELEQLTVTNDNESSYDISAPKETFRKTWNAKYTLRSHFDGVRSLAFHPVEPVLITASEDQTLKLWNLQKTIPAKKSTSLDVEPVYTFRAHTGPVLSLSVSPSGDFVFSGGLDATIRCWVMPSINVDPYDAFEPSVLANTLTGHGDAVWGLAYHGPKEQLLSCSADGTVKLWKPSNSSQPLLRTFGSGDTPRVPSSVDWVYADPAHMVAAYDNVACIIYDLESGKPVIKLDTDPSTMGVITKVVSHPTLPLTITAHEDRQIRFFDNSTGKMTHAMVAHLDSVTSLAVDSNGMYMISGSHDCSLRLWNLETKTCVQEITAHRKKFDESILAVAFHPSKPFIASAGADALAKVFV